MSWIADRISHRIRWISAEGCSHRLGTAGCVSILAAMFTCEHGVLLAYAEKPAPRTRLAAAYAAGMARNHPFIDGSKRTALLVSFAFLELNGIQIEAPAEAIY